MARKSTGKRLRFEIMKRDGFRCYYCGASPAASPLHVDHVVPIADGGLSVAENLVTACAACNGGKSSVPIDRSQLSPSKKPAAMREHAQQIRDYLAAVKELEQAQEELVDHVVGAWCDRLDPAGCPGDVASSLPRYIRELGLEGVLEAIEATAAAPYVSSPTQMRKYFLAVVRNARIRLGFRSAQ